jgi:hypothetical protein
VKTILFCVFGLTLCVTSAFGQEKRNLHVTKVTQSDWISESADNGSSSMRRKFVVWGHDIKNNYQAECEELIIIGKDEKIQVHYRCPQVESGQDYIATFFPTALNFDCKDCTATDADKQAPYVIRTQEERNSK